MTNYTAGLRATILTGPHGDCSNGGLSSRVKYVTVVGDDIPALHPVTDLAPAVMLDQTARGYLVLTPVLAPSDRPIGPMASGAYAVVTYEGDGAKEWRARLGVTFSAAIPLHDRFETAAQYEALSR